MTNNKKTALELFAIALYEKGLLIGNGDWMQNVLEEFKEIEKEQIEDAYSLSRCEWNKIISSSEYYEQTYGGGEQ